MVAGAVFYVPPTRLLCRTLPHLTRGTNNSSQRNRSNPGTRFLSPLTQIWSGFGPGVLYFPPSRLGERSALSAHGLLLLLKSKNVSSTPNIMLFA